MEKLLSQAFTFSESEEKRLETAQYYYSPSKRAGMEAFNNLLNIVLAIFIYVKYGVNPIIFAIAYITLDIILNIVDNFVSYWYPQTVLRASFEKRVDSVDSLSKKVDNLEKKFDKVNNENYDKCERCSDCSETECSFFARRECKAVSDYKFYKRRLEGEQAKLEEDRKTLEEQRVEKENKPGSEYQSKADYLRDKRIFLGSCVEKKDMDFLNPVCKSLSELILILRNKPQGYVMLPHSLMVYLDELTNILSQWSGLSDERREVYREEIDKVSTALGENISHLINKIRTMEEGNIEVSLKVLLNELESENEDQ